MPGGPERMMPWLERTLDLSPAQRERIVAVLDRARHEQVAVRESVQVWIERELTPEQRERWKQMEERFEQSRRGRWSRGPMPPDRP
jgi:Spy/CpxP family protein refolding chaperone